MPIDERTPIKRIRFLARYHVKGKMFKAQFTRMSMLEGCSSFEIHKHHEIGVKLFTFKIAVTGALGKVDMVLEDWSACLHLNPELYPLIFRLDDQIASREVIAKATSEVGRNPVHPALGVNGSFADLAVGLRLA
jgi:hypothetical protein